MPLVAHPVCATESWSTHAPVNTERKGCQTELLTMFRTYFRDSWVWWGWGWGAAFRHINRDWSACSFPPLALLERHASVDGTSPAGWPTRLFHGMKLRVWQLRYLPFFPRHQRNKHTWQLAARAHVRSNLFHFFLLLSWTKIDVTKTVFASFLL